VVGHDGQVSAFEKRGVSWEEEMVVRLTRGEGFGVTRPGGDMERLVVDSTRY